MVADQARIRRSLAILESTGTYVDPEMLVMEPVATSAGASSVTPTCYSVFTAFFGRALGHADAVSTVPTREGGAVAVAAPKKKANRLEQANEALQARVDTLHERAATQRAAATAAFKAGDKRAAMMTLKRAKAAEAAAESAGKAQMALETQIDLMEQASALGPSPRSRVPTPRPGAVRRRACRRKSPPRCPRRSRSRKRRARGCCRRRRRRPTAQARCARLALELALLALR